MSEHPYRLGIDEIRKYLPHRQPFLLVDRILEIHPKGDLDDPSAGPSKVGTRVVGIKNISYGEPCFQGHFPNFSIFPGVLIIEAMAQVASFSLYPYISRDMERIHRDFECILVGVDGVRFRRPVVPGDTLRTEVTVSRCKGKIWVFKVESTVEGEKVAEAELMASLVFRRDMA